MCVCVFVCVCVCVCVCVFGLSVCPSVTTFDVCQCPKRVILCFSFCVSFFVHVQLSCDCLRARFVFVSVHLALMCIPGLG